MMAEAIKNIILRDMTASDLDRASHLEKEAFGKFAWTRAQLEDALERNDTAYVVAVLNDDVVGLCGVQNICGDGEITNVSVDSSKRNLGIASRMFAYLLKRGCEIGCTAFTLEVRAGNASAIRLYESAGFISEGVRPSFYDSPKEDAVIYWLRNVEDIKTN